MNAAGLGEFSEESDPITLGGWVHTQLLVQLKLMSFHCFCVNSLISPWWHLFDLWNTEDGMFLFVVVVVVVVHILTVCSLFTEYLIYYIIPGAVGGAFLIALLICCVGMVIMCCRRKHRHGQLGKYQLPYPDATVQHPLGWVLKVSFISRFYCTTSTRLGPKSVLYIQVLLYNIH